MIGKIATRLSELNLPQHLFYPRTQLSEHSPDAGVVHWEVMLARLHKSMTPPTIIGYETLTVAFPYMFYTINPVMSAALRIPLFIVRLRI